MKVNQILDEMQASLTKLRGHCRKTETATEDIAQQIPSHCCTCPTEIPCPVHDRNYQELKKKLTPTAGYSPAIDPHRCFVCGIPADMGIGNALGAQIGYCRKHMPRRATGTAGETKRCKKCGRVSDIVQLDQACPFCDLDLPLHVRVAMSLGHVLWTDPAKDYRYAPTNNYIPEGCEYPLVPDYPNDLVAAMGALKEYLENIAYDKRKIEIFFATKGNDVYLCDTVGSADNLPQAICEAIVAHAEGE